MLKTPRGQLPGPEWESVVWFNAHLLYASVSRHMGPIVHGTHATHYVSTVHPTGYSTIPRHTAGLDKARRGPRTCGWKVLHSWRLGSAMVRYVAQIKMIGKSRFCKVEVVSHAGPLATLARHRLDTSLMRIAALSISLNLLRFCMCEAYCIAIISLLRIKAIEP